MRIVLITLALILTATLLYAGTGDLIVGGMIGAGNNTNPNYSVDVIGDVNITGTYRINGVSLPSALTGAVSGLMITNDATNPNTKIDVSANLIGTVVPSATMGIDCTTSGLAAGNDLDAGNLVANTWYYIWAIYNGTTIAGLASTSRTAPTMPGNYTNAHTRIIGVAKTDANAHFIVFVQQGNHFVYDTIWGSHKRDSSPKLDSPELFGLYPTDINKGIFPGEHANIDGGAPLPIFARMVQPLAVTLWALLDLAVYWSTVNDFIDTDSSQCVQIYISAALSSGWYLNVNGFELNL